MALLALASIGGILLGIVPLTQKTITLWQTVRTLSSDAELLRKKSEILLVLNEDELRQSVLTLASAVPPDKSLPSILTTIDTVSGQANIAISDVALTKPGSLATESAKKLTKDETIIGSNLLPFSVNGRGTFDEVKSFLSSVVVVRRLFRLRSMTLTMGSSITDAHVELDAFYLPYPTTVGSVSSISNLTDAEQKTITSVSSLPLASVTVVSTVSASFPTGKDDPFAL